ncbi:MAG: nitroreductase family protein [Bacteroidales bacterium]|nr:nitroreductase family protein [Bacteroidales bacterium]
MADNYLESKMEELRQAGQRKAAAKGTPRTLDTLLTRNRSFRGYDKKVVVTHDTLTKIVAVNTKIPSARNQQVLRFKLVTRDSGAEKVLENIKLGGALPELHLPFPGTEPEAFIIICSTIPENKLVDIDMGISAQSMLLRAVEMGLNGIIIGAFNKATIIKEFGLELEPLLIIAIGKGAEDIRLKPISEGEDQKYYREEGIHYVPKLRAEDLIL